MVFKCEQHPEPWETEAEADDLWLLWREVLSVAAKALAGSRQAPSPCSHALIPLLLPIMQTRVNIGQIMTSLETTLFPLLEYQHFPGDS